jgi:creatinine amidohydrolase
MAKKDPITRRRFVKAGVAGASTGLLAHQAVVAQAASKPGDDATMPARVRFAELLPHEFRRRLKERPIAYLPLGTVEWHGEHLPLGSDAIQSEGLMMECARQLGGIVMPPLFLGPDRAKTADQDGMLVGMDYADSTIPPRQLDGSCYWVSRGFHLLMIDAILTQIKRAGFQAVFADGHGPSRWSWVDNLPEREALFGLKLFGVTKGIDQAWRSQVDHAARNETSLMMHLRPDLVDLSQLPPSRSIWPQGVAGEDPRDATAEYGKECLQSSVNLVRQVFSKVGLL